MSRYDDILHLPRHVSPRRAPMSMRDRAAQFSPFSALTGYDGVIAETGRLTERCVELDGESICQLDRQLQRLLEQIDRQPTVTVTWFEPDKYKTGGSYQVKTGAVKKLDPTGQYLLFTDRTRLPFHALISLELTQEKAAAMP